MEDHNAHCIRKKQERETGDSDDPKDRKSDMVNIGLGIRKYRAWGKREGESG